ncbi:possible transposase [Nitrosococcus oceani ATCC 19707]|uniref:Possible transposase n=1 Tax=Nitrosococcus oceani (strain ATCC 19707 / BCRC 17464 / JCM 30415 / NCIMB 11848 / C-107) TaxID=323261 RepID=Q3J8I5_NITOC|nr:possible transposase [Nitrosococcus oceani ATCC 19707]EDZ67140.1 hypothetical protein NOC27_467 [Nitrosococcus oceani AFC27]
MGIARAAPSRGQGRLGRHRQRQSPIFINAVFGIMRTVAPWRDLPPDLGHGSNTHRCFIRWRDKGIREKLLATRIDEPDYEWLMMEDSHCKVHPHGAGARGGHRDMSRTKGGSTRPYIGPWMRWACRSALLSQEVAERIVGRLAA